MPREPRGWDPCAPAHVTDRGFEGRPLFVTDEDRAFFLDRAAALFKALGVVCFAWALMTNHLHLFLISPETPLGVVMHRLKTAVAMRLRRLRGERGFAFQGRFHTNVLADRDEDAYAAVLAYILLNPLRAGIVPDLNALRSYAWTSLPDLLGTGEPRLVDRERVLSAVAPQGGDRETALMDLLAHHLREPGEPAPEPRLWTPAGIPVPARAVHDAALREGTLAVRDADSLRRPSGVSLCARRAVADARGWTPDAILDYVAGTLGADVVAIRGGRRARPESEARAAAIALGCALGLSAAEMARVTGVSPQAATTARIRGAAALNDRGILPDSLLLRSPGD